MKIQVSQAELLRAAMIASVPAANFSSLPILGNVLITATESGVEFRAGGFGLRAIVPLRAVVLTPGSVTVPARLLADLAKSLPSGEVVIEETGKAVTVTAGKSVAKLAAMPAKDFPAWPEIPADTVATIPADVFRGIVDKVLPAVPAKDIRPQLMGVNVELLPSKIIAVATDGRALSKLELAVDTGIASETTITIPAHLLIHSAKLLGNDPVTLTTDGRQVALDINDVRMIENAIEGRYPDYRRVIPGNFTVELDFPREAMLETVKRVSIMANRDSCPLDLTFDGEGCKVTTEDADRGQIEDFVTSDGDAFDVCINYKLMIQALSALDADTVQMSANGPTTPVIMRGDDTLMLLIMPIKKVEQPREDSEAR